LQAGVHGGNRLRNRVQARVGVTKNGELGHGRLIGCRYFRKFS
jgi:hypothetical protein